MPALTAAGAAVWRTSPSGDVEVAVVHRPGLDDWSLPKGKPRSGETLPATAVREVAEETGHTVTLGARLGSTRYRVTEGEKVVHYWAARTTGGSFRPTDEVDELRWLPKAAASELLSYQRDRTLLAGLDGASAVTATVLLVRHAEAGKRETWRGDDDLRPLTVEGHRQAEVLRALLPLFGAQRVHSAPPLRCRQSVEGLAADLGVAIIPEPRLSEDGYLADPAAGLARLREIAAEPGGPAVVCSQGEVTPDLVRNLTDSAGVEATAGGPPEVPSRKGSYWGLFFGGGSCAPSVLLTADYYDDAVR
ncbi:MAG: NUDIX hydrolase [Pseudonocardiales bacterium]|nr:NUDIX hydrolase [Pseudonocardiales bacterium]MBV9032660.1 NUDIX hydrolase [Pseudonocardiales bacterium]MBW0010375.1 NUDIX hydrolase [Pseudonocardiales bacterium]